jgi:hypothetical protein
MVDSTLKLAVSWPQNGKLPLEDVLLHKRICFEL